MIDVQAIADISRIGAAARPAWARVALDALELVGFVVALYLVLWRSRK